MKKVFFIALLSVFFTNCTDDSEADISEDTSIIADKNEDDTTNDNDDSSDTDDDTTDNTDEDDTTDDSSSDDDSTDTPTALTYTNDVQSIISSNCLNCHGNPKRNGAPSSFNTYELVKNGASRIQSRMNSTSSPMPASGLLPAATRAIIDQWITDGRLE